MGERLLGILMLLALVGATSALAPACGNDLIPIDAAVPDSNVDAPTCMGTKAFGEVCANNDECADTCICRLFGHAKACTKTCMTIADCPSGASECKSGFCVPTAP